MKEKDKQTYRQTETETVLGQCRNDRDRDSKATRERDRDSKVTSEDGHIGDSQCRNGRERQTDRKTDRNRNRHRETVKLPDKKRRIQEYKAMSVLGQCRYERDIWSRRDRVRQRQRLKKTGYFSREREKERSRERKTKRGEEASTQLERGEKTETIKLPEERQRQ